MNDQYKENIKRMFGSLDDAPQPGMESILPEDFAAVWKPIREVFFKNFSAIRRFAQQLSQDGNGAISKLTEVRSKISRLKALPDYSCRGYEAAEINKWISANPTKAIETAVKSLDDLQHWDLKDPVTDEANYMADRLEQDIEKIENAEPRKSTVDLSKIKPAQLVKAIDAAIMMAKGVTYANQNYAGWWQTGFNQGKLPSIFATVGIPTLIMALTSHRNIYRVARTGWRNINTTSSICMDFIYGVLNMAENAIDGED